MLKLLWGQKRSECRHPRLGLLHGQFYIKSITPASTNIIYNTSPTATRATTRTSNREGIGDIVGVFLIVQQFFIWHQLRLLPGIISDYTFNSITGHYKEHRHLKQRLSHTYVIYTVKQYGAHLSKASFICLELTDIEA